MFPEEAIPSEAAADIFFFVLAYPHEGQAGFWFAWENRTMRSKDSPQFSQRYSYNGILDIILYTPPPV